MAGTADKTLPKVLCVDDDTGFLADYAQKFAGRARFYGATSSDEALRILRNHNFTFHAVMVDACVPGEEPNMGAFIQQLPSFGHRGLIHGVHGNPEFRDRLEAWGCHSVSGKDAGPSRLLQELVKRKAG